MSTPSPQVLRCLQELRFAGSLSTPDGIGHSDLGGRNPKTEIHVRIRDNRVADARFLTSGCGYLIACCSALLELTVDQAIGDCWQIDESVLIERLGGLPEDRTFCAELAIRAFQAALRSAGSKNLPDE